MVKINIADIRQEYTKGGLRENVFGRNRNRTHLMWFMN